MNPMIIHLAAQEQTRELHRPTPQSQGDRMSNIRFKLAVLGVSIASAAAGGAVLTDASAVAHRIPHRTPAHAVSPQASRVQHEGLRVQRDVIGLQSDLRRRVRLELVR
jgi:hypothetical protein